MGDGEKEGWKGEDGTYALLFYSRAVRADDEFLGCAGEVGEACDGKVFVVEVRIAAEDLVRLRTYNQPMFTLHPLPYCSPNPLSLSSVLPSRPRINSTPCGLNSRLPISTPPSTLCLYFPPSARIARLTFFTTGKTHGLALSSL